jgi:GNAT superfamily N-acetyltransferase
MENEMRISINNEEYVFIKAFQDNASYRKSFNSLTRETYGFDFEEWYRLGFWSDKYIPYSLVHQGKVVANVSVNTIDFQIDGELHPAIQIGTVMTQKAYRNKGLCRQLLKIIFEEYENRCDLFYLYANDTVLDFYPKFGFIPEKEYIYSKQIVKRKAPLAARKLNMSNEEDRALIFQLVHRTLPVSKISMIGNPELVMFYLISFLADHIYYIRELDLAAVAEFDDEIMNLQDVFCEKEFDLDEVINTLKKEEFCYML